MSKKVRECGVYKFVFTVTQQVVYIGKTEDSFKNRIDAHYRGKGVDAKFLPYVQGGCEVYICKLANNAEKGLVSNLETALINLYKPVLNDVNNQSGLSLYLDLSKLNWEKWEDNGYKQAAVGTVQETVCSNNDYDQDDYYIIAKTSKENDKCGNVEMQIDTCRVTITQWNYGLYELRDTLQILWEDWENYRSNSDTERGCKVLPSISKYPRCINVDFKRSGTSVHSLVNDEAGDGTVTFLRGNVWKTLKVLDILLEDVPNKVSSIKKIFNDKRSCSEMVYHPWNDIVYSKSDGDSKYALELEGTRIEFETEFTGSVRELKLIVDRALNMCLDTKTEFISSTELPDILEFPARMDIGENISFGFDVVQILHEGKRAKIGVKAIQILRVQHILEILDDTENNKVRRIVDYMEEELGLDYTDKYLALEKW